jgi:hypothetical protein
MGYWLDEEEAAPDWPTNLEAYDPAVWSCVHRWESARAHWWYDNGGAPFGRTASGLARRLPFIQEMVGQGPWRVSAVETLMSDPIGDMPLVENPLASYLSPVVPQRTAEVMTETGAVDDHTLVRRACAGAAVGQWEIFASLLAALYEHPERALGIARASICDAVECSLVGARGDGERAADFWETLLEYQMQKDRRRG